MVGIFTELSTRFHECSGMPVMRPRSSRNVPYSRQQATGLDQKPNGLSLISQESWNSRSSASRDGSRKPQIAAVALLLLIAWESSSLPWRCLAALGALWPIADWLQGHETQLRVSAQVVRTRRPRFPRAGSSPACPPGRSTAPATAH